jgi:hypothetical protein
MSITNGNDVDQLRAQLRYGLQDELSAWMRSRFWVAAVVVGALSFFGVRGIVQQVFDEDLKDARSATQAIIVEAETAIALASDATGKAKLAAEQVQSEIDTIRKDLHATQDQLARYGAMLAEIEQRAGRVTASFEKIDIRIAQVQGRATAQTQGSVEALVLRLQKLEAAVADLAEGTGYVTATGEPLAVVQSRTAQETERKLARAAFPIYLWIGDVAEHDRAAIISTIRGGGFLLATPEADIGTYGCDGLVECRDNRDVEPGCVVLSIHPNRSAPTVAFTEEIASLLEAAGRCARIVEDGGTVDPGLVVAVKPSA